MKKLSVLLVCVFLFTLSLPLMPVSAVDPTVTEIHVAVNGSDSAAGTLTNPLATLDGARKKVREIKKSIDEDQDIKVLFHEGTYVFTSSVNFDSNDSRTGKGRIIYQPYNNDKVTFTGAVSLNGCHFETVKDETTLARILPEAQGKVMQLDLQKEGLSDIYKYIPSEHFIYPLNTPGYPLLYVDDYEQKIARWPNEGYTVFEEILQHGEIGGIGSGKPSKPYIIKYSGDRHDRWTTAEEAMIDGFFKWDWAAEKKYISNINPIDKTFEVNEFTNYGMEKGKRYRVINLLEEIDMAGEFYVDTNNKMLYYYPPYDLSNATVELSLLPETMIKLNNASNIDFIGIQFEKTLGRVFDIQHSKDITIAGCSIMHVGQVGIYYANSEGITIQSNDIGHMGAGAIFQHSNGNRVTLESTNNKIINNRIFDVARQLPTAGTGINVIDVGSEIRNNLIHNMPAIAIRYEGNDNIISHNEIYNVHNNTSDSGAIYAGRHFNEFGNEIAYNFIHHGRANIFDPTGATVQAIFWDDQQSGQYAHHNVIHNYERGFIVGGGMYNRIENNMIINGSQTIYVDDRGKNSNSHLPGGEIYNALVAVPYNEPPYSDKYPELADILTKEPGPEYPHSNTIKDNLFYNNVFDPNIAESAITYAKDISNNIKVSNDPGFIDPVNKNFGIEPESAILEKLPGLADIDFDSIGLFVDEYRSKIVPANLDFQLTFPLDESENLETKDMIFAWDAAPDADRYTLKIATDPEMKDVVIEKSVLGNITIVNGLSSGQTRYYWTVVAENLSKQIGNRKLSKGKPFTFTTTPFDILDKAELQAAIDFTEYTLDTMVEGDDVGQYTSGTKDQLQELLDEAKVLNELEVGRQSDVAKIISKIYHFIETISKYIKKGYLGIDHMLSPDDWYVVNENSVIVEDGVLKVGLTGNNNTTTFMKEDMHGAVMNCFQMKIDFDGGWGAGFSLNQTGEPGLIWDGKLKANGYLILFKQDIIELQRYVDGKQTAFEPGKDPILVAENNVLKDKEWAEVQVGAIDVADGVMVVLKVNGETIFAELDANPPSKLGAKFTLYNFVSGVENGLQIKNSDNIPTTDLMSDIGYPEETTPPVSPTPSPTPEPTTSPIPSPTPEPTTSPTPSPTPEPTTSPIPSPSPTPVPTTSPTSDSDVPKTGDNSLSTLWILVLVFSALTLLILGGWYITTRNNKKEYIE